MCLREVCEPSLLIRSTQDRRPARHARAAKNRIGVPTGIRTPVATVKGSCPRPLDDGDAAENWWSQTGSNRRPLACHASALPAELWPLQRRGKLRSGLRYVKQTKAIASHRRRLAAPVQFTYSRNASIPVSATGDTLK